MDVQYVRAMPPNPNGIATIKPPIQHTFDVIVE
jgi:hypothetical protein